MTVQELIEILEASGDASLSFLLPTGERLPDHFHVTEVGRVDKIFIDCGGTRRATEACLLQTWTANDVHHRLAAGKLAKILRLAAPILRSNELNVEIEYGAEVASQYVLADVDRAPSELRFRLIGKQTACLASDKCGASECTTAGCCC